MDPRKTIDPECRRCNFYRSGHCAGDTRPCLAFRPVDLDPFGDNENQTTGEFPPGSPVTKTGRDNEVVPPRGFVPAGNFFLRRHPAAGTTEAAHRLIEQQMRFFKSLRLHRDILQPK